MTANILAVRSRQDPPSRELPSLAAASSKWPFELEDGEGEIVTFVARGLAERPAGTAQPALALRLVRVGAYVTDRRVVLVCEKYVQGGGWWGVGGAGAAFAMIANGISKARAANARRGTALVGHIRFDDLLAVGGATKASWSAPGSETVRFVRAGTNATDPEQRTTVDLELDRSLDGHRIAQEVSRRCAQWRLAGNTSGPEQADLLGALASAPLLASLAPTLAMHVFPPRSPARSELEDPTSWTQGGH